MATNKVLNLCGLGLPEMWKVAPVGCEIHHRFPIEALKNTPSELRAFKSI